MKKMNQNFLVKSISILVEITRILINIIILVKIRILVDFTRNIVSTRIPVISTRILINLIRNFFCPFSTRNFFQCNKFSVIKTDKK